MAGFRVINMGATRAAGAARRPEEARSYIEQVPPGPAALPQWRFRDGLAACLENARGDAQAVFSALLDETSPGAARRGTTFDPSAAGLGELAARPDPATCLTRAEGQVERAVTDFLRR